MCWKIPDERNPSNEYLHRGDAMIRTIVALGSKVMDDEEEYLYNRIGNLSREIQRGPLPCPLTEQMTKNRMYLAAQALNRRIALLIGEDGQEG